MLVDACSSIGQELSKTATKPADITPPFEMRKSRSSTSPLSNDSSSSEHSSPPPPYSQQQRLVQRPLAGSSRLALPTAALQQQQQASKEQLTTAASLATQYQLMYQQLLYQAELEYLHRGKDTSAISPALPKTALKEPRLTKSPSAMGACSVCRLAPGYTGGVCIHTDNSISSPLNHMLPMMNPGSAAAAMLAYSSKLAALNPSYLDPSLTASTYPTLKPMSGWNSSSASPSGSNTVDSRRTSANSSASSTSPRQQRVATEQPMDLQIPKSKSPDCSNRNTQLIECHWVGAEGYCGKRFHSQDDLMTHLKHHVVTCPNVILPDAPSTEVKASSRQTLRSPNTKEHDSYSRYKSSMNTSLSSISKHISASSARYQPYSISQRSFPSTLLMTPR